MTMIHVLTINWTNKEGSTVEIIRCVEEGLKERCRFTHCFQVGERQNSNDYRVASWNITRGYYLLARLTGVKYGGGSIPTRRMISYISKQAPDIIHIHCPNFYNINLYMLFDYLKKRRIPTVITNHAEFFYTGNCAHALDCIQFKTGCRECKREFDHVHPYLVNKASYEWKRMYDSFEGADRFIMTVVSPWQMNRIKESPITMKLPAVLIENGVDTNVFRTDSSYTLSREGYKHAAVHVTSAFSIEKEDLKGGYYLIELAKHMPDTLFWVLGNCSKEDQVNLPDNVKIIGHVKKEELVKYYNSADVTILTSKRETFGMPCAESLCCGTPVAAFKAGGTETIAINKWTGFSEFGDIDNLRKDVSRLRKLKETDAKKIAEDGKNNYAKEKMVERYYELYRSMAGEKEENSWLT